ncbi:hypothetical protein PCY06_03815 [Streptococcus sp. SG1]|uniref:hypothetical protein n=1 Tax=Streptococcus TaxID=1301 RepID=UPI00065F765A|nr:MULTISPECIES: hypothetical protein [Streptococcus]ARC47010.1 hypothetical protein A6J85_06250 [Streptococcus gordonii]ATF64931.1 hypothetical protein CO687_05490 [Streptococcus gordonii]MBS6244231.1 hypothetical protein [Streptococcus sp.]MDN5018529.1 hypothetical protein [Streptococcus sp. SG1]OFU73233.1 hypothetical protein HMPREF3108_00945 [Streptococcus sp. HMSC10A01]
MFSILGAVLFGIIAIMTVFVACGLPLGEFTMGGQHKILPKKFRLASVVSVAIQIFAIIIILQAGGFIPLWLSFKVTKYICFFFAAYLSLNTIMNMISKSKKEKYVMTPISLIAGICFWITALQM